MSIAGPFIDLFAGNPNVVGLDDAGGRPGPMRLTGKDRHDEWKVLTRGHLTGTIGIGVYPWKSGMVKWGCVDFDSGERQSLEFAKDLHDVLAAFGVATWVERSRSKGYHLWTFTEQWVGAPAMRHALVGACAVAGVPDKEVNPKSEVLDDDQIGNFVRLPYKGCFGEDIQRQVVIDPRQRTVVPLGRFVREATKTASPGHRIEEVAEALFVPPLRRHAPVRLAEGPWMDRLAPLARTQFHYGPKFDGDRSSYLYGFAKACVESGLDDEELYEAVRAADERHCNKYATRRDAQKRYDDIVRKARA